MVIPADFAGRTIFDCRTKTSPKDAQFFKDNNLSVQAHTLKEGEHWSQQFPSRTNPTLILDPEQFFMVHPHRQDLFVGQVPVELKRGVCWDPPNSQDDDTGIMSGGYRFNYYIEIAFKIGPKVRLSRLDLACLAGSDTTFRRPYGNETILIIHSDEGERVLKEYVFTKGKSLPKKPAGQDLVLSLSFKNL